MKCASSSLRRGLGLRHFTCKFSSEVSDFPNICKCMSIVDVRTKRRLRSLARDVFRPSSFVMCIFHRDVVFCIRVSNLCGCARCGAKPSEAFEARTFVLMSRFVCLVLVYLVRAKRLYRRSPCIQILKLPCMCAACLEVFLACSL